MRPDEKQIKHEFKKRFQTEPLIVRSPGRINLIGEHTDYNDGFVMPAAVDKEILFAIDFAQGDKSSLHALKFDETFELRHDKIAKVDEPKWANYLLGVIDQFESSGHKVRPVNCIFGGDIPVGAGMSSSAAMECGFGFAINELHRFGVPKLEIVKMAQWAEHNYAGVKCGIMDQFASMMGKDQHAILLDCRSLEFQYVPLDLKDYTIVLCDTKVKHSLVDSEYNTRRNECEKGISIMQQYYSEVKSLRDVTMDMLLRHRVEMTGKVYNRCFYVVEEINRVQQAAKDLQRGDLNAFGKKMYETHEGLSVLYEVSCKELDYLVEQARTFPQVLGARMMGGGFGGCTINIVKSDFVKTFQERVAAAYKKTFDIDMAFYSANIRQGTSVVQLESQQIGHEA